MEYTTMKFKTIIFLVLVICALFLPATSAENPYLDSMVFSTVTTNTTAPEDEFQIHFTNATFTIPLDMWNEMNPDGNDTRILNYNHTIEFPFWIEHLTARDNYSIWVNVTDNTSAVYQWYYGNPSANSSSDGDTTFEFFDDFKKDKSKWTGDVAYLNISSGIGIFNANGLTNKLIYGVTSFTYPYVYETSLKRPGGTNIASTAGLRNTGYTDIVVLYNDWGPTNKFFAKKSDSVDTVDTDVTTGSKIKETIKYASTTNISFYFDDVEGTNSPYTNSAHTPTVSIPPVYVVYGTSNMELYWVLVRKYTLSEPYVTDISEPQYYTDSLHYNTSNPYNHTIESDGTITSNRSIIAADDTGDTAQSTGASYLIITAYDNDATIVRDFTFTGDNLDWYQVANISGYYDLKNSGGIIETQSNGKFTTNLVAGTYWIEESVISITSTYSIPYSNEAYIMWTTDIPSSNVVEYSLYFDMSSSSFSTWDNATTDPVILITELARDTTYYYEVSSTLGGDTITSSTLNFTTQNNTHGFSKYFDRSFVVNDIDGWGVGESMFEAYTDSVGEYIVWTLILGLVFLVMTIRMESVVVPVVLSLISAAFLFPLLPPEHDIPAKVILGLSITGILWHLFIGRR